MRKKTKVNGSLFEQTMKLLRASGKSYLEIYDAIGLRPNWLSMVVQQRIKNPGVHTIQRLHDYLAAEAGK